MGLINISITSRIKKAIRLAEGYDISKAAVYLEKNPEILDLVMHDLKKDKFFPQSRLKELKGVEYMLIFIGLAKLNKVLRSILFYRKYKK